MWQHLSFYLAYYPIRDESLYRRYNSKWKYLLLLKLWWIILVQLILHILIPLILTMLFILVQLIIHILLIPLILTMLFILVQLILLMRVECFNLLHFL